jgi:CO dehydrogenase maturation factor
MTITIAFSGKGGTGKTTLATLAIKYFLEKKMTPVLAVDADPNANLNVGLGMEFDQTIADIREEVLDKKVPDGEVKNDYIFRRMNEILVEGDDADLLVMGRPEGQGCYCAVNHLLRDYLKKLSKHYKAIVIDTEAGMEHLSRRTTDDLDVLFLVANPNSISIRAAARTQETAQKIKLNIKKINLILNRINSAFPDFIKDMIDKERLNLIGTIPEDGQLRTASEENTNFLNLSPSPAVKAMCSILEK